MSIHIKSIFISHVYLSLFVLIFQIHCMWTEYTYIDPIFEIIRLYAVNAMESPSRMHFVKGLVAIKGCSSVPNIKPDAQVHALTTFALTSFSIVALKCSMIEVVYIKILWNSVFFDKLLEDT